MSKGGYNGGSTVIRVFGDVAVKSKEAVLRRAKKFGGGLLQISIRAADADLGPPELIKKNEFCNQADPKSRSAKKTTDRNRILTDSAEPLFAFRPQAAQAYGRALPNGRFLICKGSTAMRVGSPNVKRDLPDRDKLRDRGIIEPADDSRLYRFTQDHIFESSSKAAGIIKDGNASGPQLWKDTKTGMSLRDYLASR